MRNFIWTPLILLIFSCGVNKVETLTLLTDNPEVMLLVEFTHSTQNDFRIIPQYKEHLVPEELGNYDLLLSPDINSPEMRDNLKKLENNFNRDHLYSWTDSPFESNCLALSFDVPVILYRKDYFEPNGAPFMISPKLLDQWNPLPSGEGLFSKIGFAPVWDISYVRYLLQFEGEDFTNQGDFDYDQELLDKILEEQRSWLSSHFADNLSRFDEKYRNIPDIELLKAARVDFILTTMSSFFHHQERNRNPVEFSFFAHSSYVIPDKVLYGGIGIKAREKTTATEVLKLWLNPDFQKQYMEWKKQYREESFGFLGGFSTVPEINHRELPRYYRELESRFIQDHQFIAPLDLPLHWSDLSKDVLEPWLLDALTYQELPSLNEYYREWELHFIPD